MVVGEGGGLLCLSWVCSAGLQAEKSMTNALLAQQPQISPQYGLTSAN